MAGPHEERVFPHDPDLEEPAAAVLLNEMTAQPVHKPVETEHAPGPLTPDRRVPVIEPAEPAQWQKTVPLERPVKVDGTVLDAITVRCLSGDEFVEVVMAYGVNPDVLLPEVRAAMCGLHPVVIARLDADDQARVVAACRPFLPQLLRDDPDPIAIVASALDVARDLPT